MTSKAGASDQPDTGDIEGQDADDVEGHTLLLDPTTARYMAASRSREIERQVKDQQRVRESKAQQQNKR